MISQSFREINVVSERIDSSLHKQPSDVVVLLCCNHIKFLFISVGAFRFFFLVTIELSCKIPN